MKGYPDKDMIKCAACGHVCKRGGSEYPPDDTPAEKIYILLGTRPASMYCSDPTCQCYTIYAPTQSALEKLTEQYKSKKP